MEEETFPDSKHVGDTLVSPLAPAFQCSSLVSARVGHGPLGFALREQELWEVGSLLFNSNFCGCC